LETKRVVVIGSGIGGSGVAALLQSRGHDVVLLERNPFPGGKCWGFEKDGYLVDSGVHMFSMGPLGPHGEIDRLVGGDLAWLRRNPGSTFHLRDSFDIQYYQSQNSPGAWLQFPKAAVHEHMYRHRTAPVSSSETRLKKATRELHKASGRAGFAEIARTFTGLLKRKDVFIGDLDEMTTFEFLSRFTDNEMLHQNFAACSMILLVVPYDVSSAGELMWCVSNMFEKAYLSVPRGGSREIPGSWLRSFERNGGELILGAEVERIVVEDGKAIGVKTGDGREFAADAVVSNAGIKRTIAMVTDGSLPSSYVDSSNALDESCSFITVKYCLGRAVVDVKAPCYFNVPNLDPLSAFDYIEAGEVPEDPFLFVPVVTEWDRDAAPLGRQLLIMGVPGPSRVEEKTVAQCERILDVAERKLFDLFPAIEKNIAWSMRTTIRDTGRLTGKPTGECIGLAQKVGQTGVHKPGVVTPVEGLLLVGCDAGARGVGTEQAAGSALRVAGLLT
jgi:phytoene dehydrogenase-like protein